MQKSGYPRWTIGSQGVYGHKIAPAPALPAITLSAVVIPDAFCPEIKLVHRVSKND
jgi:hypothetical protein